MSNLRFIFEEGNDRIEQLDYEGDIVDVLHADGGTVRGFFEIYEAAESKPRTLVELDEEAEKH